MRLLFTVRSSFYQNRGGDTVQVEETAAALRHLGLTVDVAGSNSKPNYRLYDLLHFFNCTRPQDFLFHAASSKKPYLLSPIYVDYSKPASFLQQVLGPSNTAYLKALARWVANGEPVVSKEYLWRGHTASVKKLLADAAMLLPNSESEYHRLKEDFGLKKNYAVVPNAVADHFLPNPSVQRIGNKIICVARIEPLKNQLTLIRALSNSPFQLYVIGAAATNHKAYLQQCKKEAGSNIHFTGPLPQQEVVQHYQSAAVHVLPSWFETTGLSTLEAAACGCAVVIGNRGDAKEYVGEFATACDPSSEENIKAAVQYAAAHPLADKWSNQVRQNFSWRITAQRTLQAYQQVLSRT